MANETLYRLIEMFINNANLYSHNGHSVANYCVIRDLSNVLFKVNFEKDLKKWKDISVNEINTCAYKPLQANTTSLRKKGIGSYEN